MLGHIHIDTSTSYFNPHTDTGTRTRVDVNAPLVLVTARRVGRVGWYAGVVRATLHHLYLFLQLPYLVLLSVYLIFETLPLALVLRPKTSLKRIALHNQM